MAQWHPPLFPRQIELVRMCQPTKKAAPNLILASGPRYAAKTVGCTLGCIPQHAWETDRGNICILTITQSVGIDSGVWADLVDICLPQWIEEGNFGMEWAKKPYIQNVTKKPACEVTNKYGNKTRITLESLRNEDEVEARFKGKRYSMIFVNELSKFKQRKTFDTLKQCLRMMHLAEGQHLFLGDTNPADEGEGSWIWQLWYGFKNEEDIAPELKPLQDALQLIEFTIDDNLAAGAEKKASLMADFAHDDDLLQRYFYGKWVTASTDALFYKVFRPNFHVIGEIETVANKEPEIMVPEPGCFELITGQDPGSRNYGAAIIEKTFRKEPVTHETWPRKNEGSATVDVPVFKQLDEIVAVDEDLDLDDFVEKIVLRMEFWEQVMERPMKVIWRHWSDRSAFDMKVPWSEKYWHQHIFQSSGGRITLMAADRGKGSVNQRIDLFRKLLYEERYFINRNFCPQTIQMCKSIRKGATSAGGIAKGSPHKHIFDAITYALASECYDEMAQSVRLMLRGKRDESTIVTIPM